jgi:soluble lytic murein transglycosylase-like protein
MASTARVRGASFIALLLWASPARADLAFFANGHSLSVKEHHLESGSLVLTLRSGGQIVCDPAMISHFAPDEVPYPEPEDPAAREPAEGRATDPAVPFGAIIDKVSAEQGMDAKLVKALIKVESAYNSSARSRKGAMGLMQLMPETARQYAVANPYDPESNIAAGTKHLKALMERLPLDLALAAYNAGEAAVQRFQGIPPYPETRDYVTRILSAYRLVGR